MAHLRAGAGRRRARPIPRIIVETARAPDGCHPGIGILIRATHVVGGSCQPGRIRLHSRLKKTSLKVPGTHLQNTGRPYRSAKQCRAPFPEFNNRGAPGDLPGHHHLPTQYSCLHLPARFRSSWPPRCRCTQRPHPTRRTPSSFRTCCTDTCSRRDMGPLRNRPRHRPNS